MFAKILSKQYIIENTWSFNEDSSTRFSTLFHGKADSRSSRG